MPAATPHKNKTRVLFFSEAVTLAHVARPVVLAGALDPELFEVHFAQCPRYRALLGELDFTEHTIESISPQQFTNALALGKPLYDLSTLSAYVEQDLKLIEEIGPDIIVGDFRLSLAVSAELTGIPYVTISNACWSPYAKQRYTVPELPLSRILGPRLGQWVFSAGRPLVFALHAIPMHRLRRKYGLASLGFDLREVYTHAGFTLYADIPGLYSTPGLPDNHRFIGPVLWSPRSPCPDWWQRLPSGRPLVYVTLGSSGEAGLLPKVIAALGQLDVTAMVSCAGVKLSGPVPDNVYCAQYLPGEEAARRSSLVICNGGSPTTHQALAHGVPVIGLAGNLDQYLNMATLVNTGAGCRLRAVSHSPEQLCQTVDRMLTDVSFRAGAQALSRRMDSCNSSVEFCRIIDEITTSPHSVGGSGEGFS